MSTVAQLELEYRRLCMLKVLAEAPNQVAYEGLIQSALQRFGHWPGREEIQADLDWLAGQGLVRIDKHASDARTSYIATLTDKGLATSEGKLTVAGVRRPTH